MEPRTPRLRARALGQYGACLALVLLGIAGPARAQESWHTFWSVAGRHNTVYLLGSVHLLQPSGSEPPTPVLSAYRAAHALVMEIDLSQGGADLLQGSNLELLMLPAGQTLASSLGPDTYGKFLAQAKPLGVDPDFYSRFQPWFAAVTLEQLQFARLGYDPLAGVDQQFARRAQADNKPVIALETMSEQLGFFAHLTMEQQRRFMLLSLEEAADTPRIMSDVVAAWRRGDTAELNKLLTEGFEKFPDLYRSLTTDRNRRWMSTILPLLDDSRDYLVIVGALHLVGKDGLIELLERAGYKPLQH